MAGSPCPSHISTEHGINTRRLGEAFPNIFFSKKECQVPFFFLPQNRKEDKIWGKANPCPGDTTVILAIFPFFFSPPPLVRNRRRNSSFRLPFDMTFFSLPRPPSVSLLTRQGRYMLLSLSHLFSPPFVIFRGPGLIKTEEGRDARNACMSAFLKKESFFFLSTYFQVSRRRASTR